MTKTLVAYFSASNVTKNLAKNLAKVVEGDTFEIIPEIPYTESDLNWMDRNSRSSIEMADKNSRPKIKEKLSNMEDYDTVFIGFPIWWYVAPTIVNTYLESYDFAGKKIVVFAYSPVCVYCYYCVHTYLLKLLLEYPVPAHQLHNPLQ